MRKDFKEICWNVTEAEYREDSAISYSTLSTFAKKGFRGLKEILDGAKFSSASLRHGSVVDTLLTEPENFDNLYIVAQFTMPSETVKTIIEEVWEKMKSAEIYESLQNISEAYEEAFLMIINANNYGGSNWKPETKIKKIVEEGQNYYNLLTLTAGGKELVAQEDYNLAINCVDTLKNNPYTSKYLTESEDLKIYYQSKFKINFAVSDISRIFAEPVPIYGWKNNEFSDDTIRCMFDIIVVDYVNKTIQPIDLKTTYAPEDEFRNSFYKWFYDIQATMYSYILRQVIANDNYFNDFKVLPFKFMPINKFTLSPFLYNYELSTSNYQDEILDDDNQVHTPWYKLLQQVRWHIKNQEFNYPMSVVLENGIKQL